jgi:hypothetical protein
VQYLTLMALLLLAVGEAEPAVVAAAAAAA